MKKVYVLSIGILLLFCCQKKESSKENEPAPKLVWEEDFETYETETFPSAWTKDANSLNDPNNNTIVSTSVYHGSNSLKLFGGIGDCWAGIAFRSLTVAPPFEIELAVSNGNESLSGCHSIRGWIGLNQSTTWTNSNQRYLVKFNSDGTIQGAGGMDLGSYTSNTWYLVKIRYEVESSSTIKVSYWLNNNNLGSESTTVSGDPGMLSYLELQGAEGSAWFDYIKIYK